MSIMELIANPFNVDISLLIPSTGFELFKSLYESLIKSCPPREKVELLIKIDTDTEMRDFFALCNKSGFRYKILTYPKFNARHSLHHFFNDLGAIASGRILWILNDDATVHGNWYNTLMKTRGCYADNVYCVAIAYNNGKGTKQIIPLPAVSREWVNLFGEVTRFPNFDRWLHDVSEGVGRRITVKESELYVSMPQGRRVLSKQERRDVFFPSVKKTIEKYRKRLA